MAELNSSPEKSGGKVRGKKQSTRVDLTAMVDLAFLLVTFFMLTTSLNKPKAMNMAMPDDGGEGGLPVPASRTLTVCLGDNNQAMYFLGELKKPIIKPTVVGYGKSGLRQAIFESERQVKANTGKEMIVIVKPSDKSIYDNMVNTIDELNIAKVPSYAIVDITKEDISTLRQKGVY
jgi:biopolymer transport protein ExbD